MKKYITSATSYKEDDLRLPLIEAIEDVLEIDFTGAKSDWQYSENYKTYFQYRLTSGKNVGTDKYKLTIYQTDLREIMDDKYGVKPPAEKYVFNDVEAYIHKHYTELKTRVNLKYGFIICDAYFGDTEFDVDPKAMFDDIVDLLVDNGYDKDYDYSYKTQKDFLTIKYGFRQADLKYKDQYIDDIQKILTSNRYNVKSIFVQPGYVKYPTWIDPTMVMNIFYN